MSQIERALAWHEIRLFYASFQVTENQGVCGQKWSGSHDHSIFWSFWGQISGNGWGSSESFLWGDEMFQVRFNFWVSIFCGMIRLVRVGWMKDNKLENYGHACRVSDGKELDRKWNSELA